MSPPMSIEPLKRSDWKAVRAIFAEGLATGLAAFFRTPPLWRDFDAGTLAVGRVVARRDGQVLGWAALKPVPDA